MKVKSLKRDQFFATPWTVTYQAPPSMGFFRQEYWSGLPFPSPEDVPNPGIEPGLKYSKRQLKQLKGVIFGKWEWREKETRELYFSQLTS